MYVSMCKIRFIIILWLNRLSPRPRAVFTRARRYCQQSKDKERTTYGQRSLSERCQYSSGCSCAGAALANDYTAKMLLSRRTTIESLFLQLYSKHVQDKVSHSIRLTFMWMHSIFLQCLYVCILNLATVLYIIAIN